MAYGRQLSRHCGLAAIATDAPTRAGSRQPFSCRCLRCLPTRHGRRVVPQHRRRSAAVNSLATPFSGTSPRALITSDCPHGSLFISDLELAALIAHKVVIATHCPVAERTLWMATDNRAALAWSDKGSSTSTSARAYLLRLNSLHQRVHRYVATHNHVARKTNVMADDTSHLWHLSDSALLTHFATHYPQASPWQLLTLTPGTNLALTGTLCKQRPAHAFLDKGSTQLGPHGSSGPLSVLASPWPPITSPRTPSLSSRSSPNACAAAPLPPAVDLCGLARWRMPYARWDRRMPGWGHGPSPELSW